MSDWEVQRPPHELLFEEAETIAEFEARVCSLARGEQSYESPDLPEPDLADLSQAKAHIPGLITYRVVPQPGLQLVEAASLLLLMALTPFVQSLSASMGAAAAESLRAGMQSAASLFRRHRDEMTQTLPQVSDSRPISFVLVDPTGNIRVELPTGGDDSEAEARAAVLLPQVDFDALGETPAVLYWLDGAWMAAVILSENEPASLRWDPRDGCWELLHGGSGLAPGTATAD